MKQINNLYRRYLDEVINFYWIAVGLLFYIYAVMLKGGLVAASYETGIAINNWDITLGFLNDMYIIVYFIIPVSLIISIRIILAEFDYQIIIRFGSYKKWVYNSLIQFGVKISPLVVLWIFVSLFMIIGLPKSIGWSDFSKTQYVTNTLYELSALLEQPILAFFLQVILFIISLLLLHTFLAIGYVITKHKFFIMLVSFILFFIGSIGFKIFPQQVAFFSPTTYFSITKGVDTFHSIILIFLIIIMMIVFLMLVLGLLDYDKKMYINSIRSYLPVGIYLLFCIISISSTAINLASTKNNTTIWDVWVMSFMGVNAESFTYQSYFAYLIVFFGFIYLIQVFLNNELVHLSYYKIIRYQNLQKWFWAWLKKLLLIVIGYLTMLLLFSIIIPTLLGVNPKLEVTLFSVSLYDLFYHFFINGFLQITFYIMAVFIISWISKETSYTLILISVFMILMLPGINQKSLIPVGLNSMVNLITYSPYYQSIILLVVNIISIFTINYIFKQSFKI